ncbi:GTPase regulator Nrf1 [Dimargaris cristalligena]|nr:GTPase regulator Nrf1 [Dimargaris cristalligena]
MRTPRARRTSISSQSSARSQQHRSLKNRGIMRSFRGLFRRSKANQESQLALRLQTNLETPAEAAERRRIQELPILPKNFFANERTFLAWLRTSALAGGLGLAILNFGTTSSLEYMVPAATFTVISIGLMFYSLIQFWTRANRLTRRETGTYDDRTVTTVVLLVVLIGIAINLGLSLNRDATPPPS